MEKKNLDLQLKWLESEKQKDLTELNNDKLKIINEIKSVNKELIIPKKEEKLSVWKKITRVLMG
jgi:hypothetical protein